MQLTIEIADPDQLVEEVEVGWGDEDVTGRVERVINETMEHRYAFQSEPYLGRVTARTTEGVEVTSAFEVRLQIRLHRSRTSTCPHSVKGEYCCRLLRSMMIAHTGYHIPSMSMRDGTPERSGFGTVGEVLSFQEPVHTAELVFRQLVRAVDRSRCAICC